MRQSCDSSLCYINLQNCIEQHIDKTSILELFGIHYDILNLQLGVHHSTQVLDVHNADIV